MSRPRSLPLPHLQVPGVRYLTVSNYRTTKEILDRYWAFYIEENPIPPFTRNLATQIRQRRFKVHVTLEEIFPDE